MPVDGRGLREQGYAQEAILEAPMDVEELSRLGSRKGSCPYYATRAALPGADLVLLPYASLLSHVSQPCRCTHPHPHPPFPLPKLNIFLKSHAGT